MNKSTKEIKFRIWNGTKMVYGPTDDIPNPSWVLAAAPLYDFPVQQCTGLKDKNGKEVYEGDIVQFEYWVGDFAWEFMDEEESEFQRKEIGKSYIGTVEPSVGTPCNFCLAVPLKIGIGYYDLAYAGGLRSEIVGNVYQAPIVIPGKIPENVDSYRAS